MKDFVARFCHSRKYVTVMQVRMVGNNRDGELVGTSCSTYRPNSR